MSQLHLFAQEGDVAPLVLLPGDPDRATFIAETYFDKPKRYTEYRHLYGYTGSYKGMPVSVQTTGMGCPSLAIVVEELIRLGAKTLVRVGTAGIIRREVKPGELIIATASLPHDGTTPAYTNRLLGGLPFTPSASFTLVRAAVQQAEARALPHHIGLIRTADAFYGTTPEDVAALASMGVLAEEMEAATLLTLAALRNVEASCLLTASNYIGDAQFVAPEVLQQGVRAMVEVVLEASYQRYKGA